MGSGEWKGGNREGRNQRSAQLSACGVVGSAPSESLVWPCVYLLSNIAGMSRKISRRGMKFERLSSTCGVVRASSEWTDDVVGAAPDLQVVDMYRSRNSGSLERSQSRQNEAVNCHGPR